MEFACALAEDGVAACWGQDCSGELQVPALRFAQLDLGYYHGCGVTTDAGLACWGWNDHGQQPGVPAPRVPERGGPHGSGTGWSTCPYEGLGLEYLLMGRPQEAEPLLLRAIELAPGIEARKYTALAEIRIGQGRLDEAAALLRQGLELDPHSASTRELLHQLEAGEPPEPRAAE